MTDAPAALELPVRQVAWLRRDRVREVAFLCTVATVVAWWVDVVPPPVAIAVASALTVISLFAGRFTPRHDDVLTVRGARWSLARANLDLPLQTITAGWIEPCARGWCVVLQLPHGDGVRFEADARDDAARCLDALRQGVGTRTLAVETHRAWQRGAWLFGALALGFTALALAGVALLLLVVMTWAGMVLLVPALAAMLGAVAMARPVDRLEVLVGADGVSLRGELSEEFVSYARVRDVEGSPAGIALALTDDTRVLLTTQGDRERRGQVLLQRLRDALSRYREAPSTGAVRTRLSQENPSVTRWRDELRAMLAGDGAYRGAAVQRDDVARMVDDPRADGEARLAAALALCAGDDDDAAQAKTRVRIAADATASEPLRSALQRASAGEADERAIVRFERVYRAQRARG